MITVYLNDNLIDVSNNTSVLELINQLNSSSNGIAIAVNNKVLPKHSWEQYKLKSDDKILIINATQGG